VFTALAVLAAAGAAQAKSHRGGPVAGVSWTCWAKFAGGESGSGATERLAMRATTRACLQDQWQREYCGAAECKRIHMHPA
jgi:hypothetical protein